MSPPYESLNEINTPIADENKTRISAFRYARISWGLLGYTILGARFLPVPCEPGGIQPEVVKIPKKPPNGTFLLGEIVEHNKSDIGQSTEG